MKQIYCTVGVLTKNSAATLRRSLESVRHFSDIVICDGGSTDETRSIAEEFGARIIEQDKSFLDESNRISNFSAVRNQFLQHAKEQWFLWLDSDEYIGEALAEEIAQVIAAGKPNAYWVPRKYVYEGRIIEQSITYPVQQMRFFHRGVATGFIKPIHERVETTTEPLWLKNFMYVPVPESPGAMKDKWRHYLSLERSKLHAIPFFQRLRIAAREGAIGCMYALRLLRVRVFGKGTKLPLRYETARIWYQAQLIATLFT